MVIASRRRRQLVRTWFDMNRDDDRELLGWIEDWKTQRKFLPYLRQALWMFISLVHGDISPIVEYFPFVVDAIRAPDKKKIAELEAKLRAAQERIKELEHDKKKDEQIRHKEILDAIKSSQIQPSQAANPLQAIIPSQTAQNGSNGNIRQITAPTFDIPNDDDDEPLIIVDNDTEAGKRASENFLKSLDALQASTN
jgi:TolA-binding protein